MRLDPLFALMEDWADGKVMFERNGPRELDSAVSEIFLGFQAAKSR